MIKQLFFLLFVVTAFQASAQTPKAKTLAEINKDIWIPFKEGVNTDKDELYINVHSKDFHWVAPGNKGRIMDFAEYVDDSKMVMAGRRDKKEKSELEIRFLERNVKGDFATEKCIKKFTLYKPGAAPQVSYGISQYFLRKENGTWKVLIQYGSREKADEQLFNSAYALGDVDKVE